MKKLFREKKEKKENLWKRAKTLIKKKSFRIGTYTAAATTAVVIIAVIVNLCVGAVPAKYTQLDMTSYDLYSVSEQTEEVVSALDQEVTVYYIVQEGNEDAVIEQLLNHYQELSGMIKIEKVDPVERPTFASQYTDQDIYNNSFIVVSGEKSRYISYYDIYESDYSYDSSRGSYSEETSFNGEGALTAAVNYVTSKETVKAYALEGHGEASLPSNLKSAIEKENITTDSLNLLTEGEIPKDCQCLIIFGPSSDISDSEVKTIETYLEQGGKLMLITDCLNERLNNLYGLMENYGVEAVDGMIVEGDSSHFAQGYANYLVPELESHEITDPLIENNYYVLVPIAQGIRITAEEEEEEEEEDGGLSVSPLLMTTDKAFSKSEGLEADNAEKEEGDITSEDGFALGVAIDKTQDEGETSIVWFTSTYIADEQVDTLVAGGNSDLLTNAFGWLCGMEDSITIHAKAITSDYLTLTAAQTDRWSFILVAVIPFAFIITGIVVWIKRRKK